MRSRQVSVVIPTRDRADLLALTLCSVLSQQGIDLHVIVVDDGEACDTAEVIGTFDDPRLHLVRNDGPHGVSGARNCGIRAARGEWVAFCDDDDLWSPEKLAEQLSAADRSGAAWTYAGEVTVDGNLRVLSGSRPPTPDEVIRALPTHNSVPAGASNVIVRAETLASAGAFDPRLRTSEDWDLWLRLARVAGRPACVARPLVALRTHGRMASRDPQRMLADIQVIADRHGVPVDIARHHRWAAWMALEAGDTRAAVRHYARAVRNGDWRSAGRAIVALLHPGITRSPRTEADRAWAAQADEWLHALRGPGARTHPRA